MLHVREVGLDIMRVVKRKQQENDIFFNFVTVMSLNDWKDMKLLKKRII